MTGSCSLYYFPEIPCGADSGDSVAVTRKAPVNDAFKRNDAPQSAKTDPLDSPQVRSLIEEAFNKGLEQGRAETLAAQQEKTENAVKALESSVNEFRQIRRRDIDDMETETVRLALAIAKKIIGAQTEHGAAIRQVVKKAMEKVNDPRHLTLRLNPKEIETVKALRGELIQTDDPGTVFRIEADEGIQRGGCLIETKLGDVDARIDKQIAIIEGLLIEQLPKRPPQD